VSLETTARSTVAAPSITTWTRLEPLPRDASLSRSLAAQVRDPLWMLARQWQVLEFQGADAGSPVQATFAGQQQTVTTYCPGTDPSATVALDQSLPLEVHVEREQVLLRLRGSVQLGLYFEWLIGQQHVANAGTVIEAFRQAFPIASVPPDPTYAPVDALRFRALMAAKVTDGEALYASAAAVAAGQPPPTPLPGVASDPGMSTVLSDFVAYRANLFSEPSGDDAWQPEQLDYAFALGSPTPGTNLLLPAQAFPGGHLDWYSFGLQTADPTPVSTGNPATVTTVSFVFLPNHVVFRAMHDPRWWTFEDSAADLGSMDAQQVDLAKLLVLEFALIYGCDWFAVPVPTPIGSLASVTTLVVSDTFGLRTLIRPSEDTTVNAGERPWSMFKLSGTRTRSDFIMMAPTLGVVDDATPLEAVQFLRDDMAAMAWAVEHQLQGDMDTAVDGAEAYLQRLATNPAPPPPVAAPGSPAVYYTTEIPVPDNWIPMVPVQTSQGALYLRRGTMAVPTTDGVIDVTARALILEPRQPFFVTDHVVPRAGLAASRYFRRTRSQDGTTFVWMARTTGPGTGPGWSGLRFDAVRDMALPPSE
jgi:hypothetical protein